MNPTSASRIRKIWGPVRSSAGSGIATRVSVASVHLRRNADPPRFSPSEPA
jgi:hypothetical protein